jgi:hypothetical protein
MPRLFLVVRFDQPLNRCGYLNNGNQCFTVTTTQAISLIDLKDSAKLNEVKTIDYVYEIENIFSVNLTRTI